MMTWQIMMGAQLISIVVSAAVVVAFMLKKESLDTTAKNRTVKVEADRDTTLIPGTI